jgi:hypothetical protein
MRVLPEVAFGDLVGLDGSELEEAGVAQKADYYHHAKQKAEGVVVYPRHDRQEARTLVEDGEKA